MPGVHFAALVLLQDGPEGQRLCLPFGHLLFLLHLLDLLFYHLALLHHLHLLVVHQPVFLRIELFPLLLEHLFAVGFMFGNAVGVELSAAAHPAHLQSGRVVLHDVHLVLSIYLLDASFLLVFPPPIVLV